MERTKYIISSYDYNDVYSQDEKVNVPFSWEYKPGLSKVTHQLSKNETRRSSNLVLQPPPYRRRTSGVNNNDKIRDEDTIWGPLICAVQSSSLRISSFRMESPKEEDPFIEAYKNCTRSPLVLKRSNRNKSSSSSQRNNGYWAGIVMKYMHILSCKYSGDVISMVYGINRNATVSGTKLIN